jgi:hypothetical protein
MNGIGKEARLSTSEYPFLEKEDSGIAGLRNHICEKQSLEKHSSKEGVLASGKEAYKQKVPIPEVTPRNSATFNDSQLHEDAPVDIVDMHRTPTSPSRLLQLPNAAEWPRLVTFQKELELIALHITRQPRNIPSMKLPKPARSSTTPVKDGITVEGDSKVTTTIANTIPPFTNTASVVETPNTLRSLSTPLNTVEGSAALSKEQQPTATCVAPRVEPRSLAVQPSTQTCSINSYGVMSPAPYRMHLSPRLSQAFPLMSMRRTMMR